MTTAQSPRSRLKAQAERMAMILKAAERGEAIAGDVGGKIAAARSQPSVKFAVAMDDKILTVEMTWQTIGATSEAGIAEYLLNQMRESRDVMQ